MEFVLEQLFLIAAFCTLAPLVSFTIYFNVVYTPRVLLHASQLSAVRGSLASLCKPNGNVVGSIAMGVMLVIASVAFFAQTSSDASLPNKPNDSLAIYLRSAFILLSAVSTPNMILMSMRLNKSSVTAVSSKDTSARHSLATAV